MGRRGVGKTEGGSDACSHVLEGYVDSKGYAKEPLHTRLNVLTATYVHLRYSLLYIKMS